VQSRCADADRAKRGCSPLYEEAFKLRPDDAGAARGLGIALLAARSSPTRSPRLNRRCASIPRTVRRTAVSAMRFGKSGRLKRPSCIFETAVRLQPDFEQAHYDYARALARAGRLPDAIAEYQKAITLKPDDVQAHYNLGNAYAQTGQLRQAVAAYEDALKYRPDYPEAHNNCGTILRRLGRIEEAARTIAWRFNTGPTILRPGAIWPR